MALGDVIARLSVVLGLDTAAFEKGATIAEKRLAQTAKQFERIGKNMTDLGKSLVVGLTVPIAAAGAGIIKATGDFEAGLNRIQIATEATSGEMQAMSELALQIGKNTTFGASDAASAMEMLAKAGIDTKTILGGAAEAVTNLAAAAGSGLDPAASAISDSINQFHLAAKDLPTIVNQITGAVNESKFEFSDFTAGMAQGGGVAASAGLSFQDFAATLAATSSQFASGSDAGTSLKTFLLALTPTTKSAAEAMKAMGLNFFDAAGKMRPIAEIAQMLQDKFAGLSNEERNSTFKAIFGTDAIRTAVGLMNQGAEGLDRIQAKLNATNAADQAAKRMAGFNGQMEQLKGSLETLAIRIGQSGVLEAVTGMVTGLANLIDQLSTASPETLRFATVIALVAAAIGPVLIVAGQLVSAIGVLMPLAASLGGALATALPILAGLAAVGAVIYANWDRIGPALSAFWQQVQETLGPPLQELISAVTDLFNEFWNGPLGEGVRQGATALVALQLAWGKAFGPVVLQGIRLVIDTLANVFRFIADGVKLVSGVFNGDWRTAFEAASGLVNRLFGGLPGYVIGLMQRMVEGIRTWVVDRLSGVWDSVASKIESVKSAFFGMFDAVVGHSYVPDMVDGIAAQMARLDSVMVKPVQSATDRAKTQFQRLADEVRPLLDRLFPEAAALNSYRSDVKIIGKAERGKVLTGAEADEARVRAAMSSPGGPGLIDVTKTDQSAEDLANSVGASLNKMNDAFLGWQGKAQIAAVVVAESFKDAADKTLSALDRMAQAIKGGGFLDIFSAVVGLGLQLGSIGLFGKTIAKNINTAKVPGFATGTNFAPGGLALVGERGPELVDLPRGSRVTPNSELGRMSCVEIIPSPYFDVRVDGRAAKVAAPMASASGHFARQAAGGDSARRRRRMIT